MRLDVPVTQWFDRIRNSHLQMRARPTLESASPAAGLDQNLLKPANHAQDAICKTLLQPMAVSPRKAIKGQLLIEVLIEQIAMGDASATGFWIDGEQDAVFIGHIDGHVIESGAVQQPEAERAQVLGLTGSSRIYRQKELRELPGESAHRQLHLFTVIMAQDASTVGKAPELPIVSTILAVSNLHRKSTMGTKFGPAMDSMDAAGALHTPVLVARLKSVKMAGGKGNEIAAFVASVPGR